MPIFEPDIYIATCNLNIHDRPGLSSKLFEEKLKAGERVEITKVKELKYSIWGKLESGWICMSMNHTSYVKVQK